MHVTDDQCELLAGGDLPAAEQRSLREHVAACETCQRHLSRAELERAAVARALRDLDHPAPLLRPDAVVARVSTRRSPGQRQPRLAAAAVILLIAAGAAAAMPGSPVRDWLSRRTAPGAAVPRHAAMPEAPAGGARITVVPESDTFELVFETPPAVRRVRLALVQTSEASVRAAGGAVEYAVLPAGIVVRNRGAAASFDVRVPAALSHVRVRVGDRAVFDKRGSSVTTSGRTDASGAYVIDVIDAAPRP